MLPWAFIPLWDRKIYKPLIQTIRKRGVNMDLNKVKELDRKYHLNVYGENRFYPDILITKAKDLTKTPLIRLGWPQIFIFRIPILDF